MTKAQIEKSKKILDELDQIEETRVKTIDKRNSIELYIYEKTEWFNGEAHKVNLSLKNEVCHTRRSKSWTRCIKRSQRMV